MKINEQIKHLRALKDHIYASSIDMDESPICHMYYVTTGKWMDDANLMARINSEVTILNDTNLFSMVKFTPIDSEGIKDIYRQLKRKIVKEIPFEKHTILPLIDGVQEAYIGILPCTEYIKLICDSEGNIQRSLFYDNVRDFQGNNPVVHES